MKQRSVVLLCIMLVVSSASLAFADHHAVKITTKDGLGHYLTDAKGMTLYWFTKDSSGQSACTADCLVNWPIFYRERIAAPKGIDPNDFGTITRTDGEKQTTFRGFPLYYFVKDSNPGDTSGQGVNNVWYVVDPLKFPPK
jgi:predicted lipoprotein with Yx(FWY)xxD motif